jgi:hypothetical protein
MIIENKQNSIIDFNKTEWIVPLTIDPHIFISKKPIAVLLNEERIEIKSWRQVYTLILKQCNKNEQHHKTLLYLRGKVSGKCRDFLSNSPDGMTCPVKIDEDMYAEVHYGSQTLMHILVQRILYPVNFDCSEVQIVIKI